MSQPEDLHIVPDSFSLQLETADLLDLLSSPMTPSTTTTTDFAKEVAVLDTLEASCRLTAPSTAAASPQHDHYSNTDNDDGAANDDDDDVDMLDFVDLDMDSTTSSGAISPFSGGALPDTLEYEAMLGGAALPLRVRARGISESTVASATTPARRATANRVSKPGRVRKKKPRICELSEEQQRDKRDRNKIAAEKCREKKRALQEAKDRHADELERENQQLRLRLEQLRADYDMLSRLLDDKERHEAELKREQAHKTRS
mmetsp:Transcript_85633/g.266276  ORF Transcript_85633/g.266276 Transcript_85633/m.266276 type:complete len:259 (+) Transcript_85633:138-914(+)